MTTWHQVAPPSNGPKVRRKADRPDSLVLVRGRARRRLLAVRILGGLDPIGPTD
jgi:hypothetical protein